MPSIPEAVHLRGAPILAQLAGRIELDRTSRHLEFLGSRPVQWAVTESHQASSSPLKNLALGALIGQGFLFLSTLITARLVGPAEVGRLGIFMALVSIFGPLATLRLDQALGVSKRSVSAKLLLRVLLVLTPSVALVVTLAYSLFGGPKFLSGPPFLASLALFLGVLAAGIQSTFNFYHLWSLDSKTVSSANAAQGVSIGLLQLLLASLGVSGGLVGAQLGGRFTSLAMLSRGIRFGSDGPKLNGKRFLSVLKACRSFVFFSAPAAIANELTGQLPVFLCETTFGTTQVGYQTLAYRILATPVLLVAGIFYQSMLAEAGAAYRSDRSSLERVVKRYSKRLGQLGLVVLVGSAVAQAALPWVLGPTWQTSASLLIPFGLRFSVYLISFPFEVIPALVNRQSLLLLSDGLRLGVIVGAFGIAPQMGLNLFQVTWLYCVPSALISLTFYLIYLRLGLGAASQSTSG